MSNTLRKNTAEELLGASSSSDEEIAERVKAGDVALFEIIMRRYNQRLFRIVHSIVENEHEAEEVVQEAYVRAYIHLGQFAGLSQFSTWLTKIAIYEAYAQKRRLRRHTTSGLVIEPSSDPKQHRAERDPEQIAFSAEIRGILEGAIQGLPETYRTVFVMRTVEDMSTAEVAECLGISAQNVKTRLLRGRALLRRRLADLFVSTANRTFEFLGNRCDRIVAVVFDRIAALRAE